MKLSTKIEKLANKVEGAKRVKTNYSEDEIKAIGYYFAVSNLAIEHLVSKKQAEEALKRQDWRSFVQAMDHALGVAEMDVEGGEGSMQPEVKSWTADARKGDKYVVEEWEKIKAGKAPLISGR